MTSITLPQVASQGNRVSNFFYTLHLHTPASWPDECQTVSPFAFPWFDEVFREQFIHNMTTDTNGHTMHAAKDLLRFLMYRFRVAKFRRDNPPPPFSGHRWVWHKNSEVQRKTGLSDYQLRTAVAYLKKRRLIVQVYDSGVANHCPHYRPTNDLFRAAHTVCLLTNRDFLAAEGYCDETEPREWMQTILTERYEDLASALRQFAESEESRGRLNRLNHAFFRLIRYAAGEDVE